MKKYGFFSLSLAAFAIVLLLTGKSIALGPFPPGPMDTVIDFVTNAAETVEAKSAEALALQDKLQELQTQALSDIKSFGENVKNQLQDSLFGKKENQSNLASVRTIEKCKIADITDEESVKEAFHELFLTYPTDILEQYPENQRAVKLAYRDKAVEFGNDAMIEMYITVRDLEEKMEMLKSEYDELSACYVQGKSSDATACVSASSSEEELGVWSNYYKLNSIYDSMLKITEELTALKAQYEVAQAILSGVEPIEEETEDESAGKGDKVSYNDVFRYVQTDKQAYAQMFTTQSVANSATSVQPNMSASAALPSASKSASASTLKSTQSAVSLQASTKTSQPANSATTQTKSVASTATPQGNMASAVAASALNPTASQTKTSVSAALPAAAAMKTTAVKSSAAGSSAATSLATSPMSAANISLVSTPEATARDISTSKSASVIASTPTSATSRASSSAASESLGGMALTNNNAAAEVSNPDLEIVQAKAYNVKSPLAGTADQFQAMLITNNAYQTLQKSLKAHNFKQQMPEYRKLFEEYNKMKELHEKALDLLVQSENCAINYLGNYFNNPSGIWYGNGCKVSGHEISCDSGRNVTSETLKNLLPGDALCANDSSKICSNYGINSYSSREGMSGWLISAYKTAKAEKTIDLNEEDFATNMTEENQEGGVENLDALSEQINTEQSSGTMDSSLLRPSDTPKTEAAIRENFMVSWQIGAEAAKDLADDMVSGTSEWGTLKARYPLWNDDKLVYAQYLTEKYKNMRIYIKKMDLRPDVALLALKIKNLLPTTGTLYEVDLGNIWQFNTDVLDKLYPLVSKDKEQAEQNVSELTKVRQQTDAAADGIRSSFNAEMVSLNNRKASIYQNLDSENIQLNEYKTAYNTAIENKQSEKGNIEGQKVVVEISQARKAKAPNAKSNFEATAESSIKESNSAIEEADKEAEGQLSGIEIKRESIDSLNTDLENNEETIARSKSNFAASASTIEANNLSSLKAALADMESSASASRLGASSYLPSLLNTTTGSSSVTISVLSSIIGVADNATEDLRQAIIARIDAAAAQIEAMGDNRFVPERHADIVKIHQQMLDDIKNLNANVSISDLALSAVLSADAVKPLVKESILNKILADICKDDTCYTADTEYFVGLDPKERDFKAPAAIESMPTPPLREIVHFDTADFENVIKSDTWMTTKYDFLNQGQTLPAIWQKILGKNGFVERDVDIEEILSHNESVLDALRQGAGYPCTSGKYDVYIRNGVYYVTNAGGDINNFCSDIQSISIPLANIPIIRLTNGDKVEGVLDTPPAKTPSSELAVILAYRNGLTFNDRIKQIMEFYEEMENSDDIDESAQEQNKIYRKELLTRNQFGNFLDFVEQEMNYQDNMDKLEVKLDETRQKIKEQLAEINYVPEEKFDLSEDAIYNEIMEKLENYKNQNIENAVGMMQSITASGDLVEEKVEKINNLVSALQMDNEEYVQLNDNTSADSSLSEEIKRKKTDGAVRDEYDKEGEDVHENNLNSFEEPYCANYN